MEKEIMGKKHLTNIGTSLVLIIDKAFLVGTDLKSGDLVEFQIKKIEVDDGKKK